MTKRNVTIRQLTSRVTITDELFDDGAGGSDDFLFNAAEDERLAPLPELPEPDEMIMEGRLVTDSERVSLIYEEGALTGMEGSVTELTFTRENPNLVTMMRTGAVGTALIFEEGKRHICVYNTPFSDFEICVVARKVTNALLREGIIELDYLVEIHGAQAEHCKMSIRVKPARELFSEE